MTDINQVGLEKLKDVLMFTEKKKRNLEKRKNKLDSYKSQKTPLVKDQEIAVSKYGEVESSIATLTEITAYLESTLKETEKVTKKIQKTDKLEKRRSEIKLVDFSLRIYNVLDRITNTEMVGQALVNECAISETDILMLKAFYEFSSKDITPPSSINGDTSASKVDTHNSQGWKRFSENVLSIFNGGDRPCLEGLIDDVNKLPLLAKVTKDDVLRVCRQLMSVSWLLSCGYLDEASVRCAKVVDRPESEDTDENEWADATEDATSLPLHTAAAPVVSHVSSQNATHSAQYTYESADLSIQQKDRQQQCSHPMPAQVVATEEFTHVPVTSTLPTKSDQQLTDVITPIQSNFNFMHSSCLNSVPEGCSSQAQATQPSENTGSFARSQTNSMCSAQAPLEGGGGRDINSGAMGGSDRGDASRQQRSASSNVTDGQPMAWYRRGVESPNLAETDIQQRSKYGQDEDVFASATRSDFLHSNSGRQAGNSGIRGGPRGNSRGASRVFQANRRPSGAGVGAYRGGPPRGGEWSAAPRNAPAGRGRGNLRGGSQGSGRGRYSAGGRGDLVASGGAMRQTEVQPAS